jgi:hypothetical protein
VAASGLPEESQRKFTTYEVLELRGRALLNRDPTGAELERSLLNWNATEKEPMSEHAVRELARELQVTTPQGRELRVAQITELPPVEFSRVKKAEAAALGMTAGELSEAVRERRSHNRAKRKGEEQGENVDELLREALAARASLRPIQVIPGHVALNAVQEELLKLNALYQRNGQLVRVIRVGAKEIAEAEADGIKRETGAIITADVNANYLWLLMSRCVSFQRFDKRTEQWVTRDPPEKWPLSLMAAVDEWRFPMLNGVVTAPFLRPDGTLVQARGYDRASGIYADFRPENFPPINEAPSHEDAARAVKLLRELFNDFPFCETNRDSHLSAAIAATVTATIRRALRLAPGFALNAIAASSGKTTLQELVGIVATGRPSTSTDYPEDEAEMGKKLLTFVMDGEQAVLFDNVPEGQLVDSAQLNKTITNGEFTGRILGANKNGKAPAAVFWMVNGNGLQIGGDINTRVLYASLDPQMEAPEERVFRRDIHAHATEHRGELLAACLTIVLAYRAARHPAVDIPGGSRFVQWDRMVRRAIRWAGLPDPLATQKLIKAADPKKRELMSVLTELRRVFGADWFKAGEAIRKAQGDPAALAPQVDQDLLDAIVDVSPAARPNSKSFGRYLTGKAGRIAGGMRLKVATDAHAKQGAFCVEVVPARI